MMLHLSELRRRVITELMAAGFEMDGGLVRPPDPEDKEGIRALHATQRRQVLVKNAKFIAEHEPTLLHWFADGANVNPAKIEPNVIPVDSEEQAAVFRFASLHWSVPVSHGYGRRTRFLLVDRHNDKLIGIFALGDPVFNLGVRDSVIGWGQRQRRERLYNVFDAYVLGAVQPYRQLIGGKLVALAAVSNSVTAFLERKYKGTTTHIQGVKKIATPVLITTTSALGRSSTYNRIKYHDRKVFIPVGYSKGFGHFQFSEELFEDLVALVEEDESFRGNEYGEGPNWKIRTIRSALEKLGLSGGLLRHGIRREVYLAPLGVSWRAFLRGETDNFQPFDFPLEEMASFFRERWAVPRAERRPKFRQWDRDNIRLTQSLEEDALQARTLF
ncbi:MAG TPA: Druantia anti-phage system protein DruA [Nitriliruptorales bacterium]|nr:Druantia anti-phage system protein DruA [Nitriliruptorales bacterium]